MAHPKYRTLRWNEDGTETRSDHDTIEAVAEALGIDAETIAHDIEEHGRCDVVDTVVWSPDDNWDEYPCDPDRDDDER